MKAWQVLNGGIYTTLQDIGRPGFMKYGIPASGAADRFSFRVANLLVGNPLETALLEITLIGLELLSLHDLGIAVTGGDLSPTLNGIPLAMWQSLSIKEGDRVAFPKRKAGFRAYLAVQGGFCGPKLLNSRSVFTRGLMGSTIQAGEILKTEREILSSFSPKKILPEMVPPLPVGNALRVILGPQEDRFTPEGIETFLSSAYCVSPQSDRMGYRLQGPPIEHRKGADIISEPVAPGAIQVPGDGLPILLLWDAPVSGGYTKIGNVISADLDCLAQVMPGDSLRFCAVSLPEAHEALRNETACWERVKRTIEGQG